MQFENETDTSKPALFDFDKARRERGMQQMTEMPSLQALLAERARIDSLLPPSTFNDINVEEELMLQFQLAKELQINVMSSMDVPANQQAQVLNACVAALAKIQDTQAKFYSQERFKRIEAMLIAQLKKWPVEMANEFIDEYAKMLEEDDA
jgi:hypothetical protein